MTTGEPGYFLSQAIRDDSGHVLGLIAIKIALQELEREWLQTPDIVLASDAHGVVFLASQDAWRYRLLQPLSDEERRELKATQQYAEPAAHRYAGGGPPRTRRPAGARACCADMPAPAGPHAVADPWPCPARHWQLHLVHDHPRQTGRQPAAAGAAGGGGWLALALLVLFVRQRQRLARLRQRSRQELETVLQQHAQELRTAQDGIVQAASKPRSRRTRASRAAWSTCPRAWSSSTPT